MIIKAEGKDTVVLTDIVFLCKSVEMHNFLTKSGCESRYINPTPFGMMVIRALESECFVLVGEFSEEEITLVRARCRPKVRPEVMVDFGIRGKSLASKSIVDMMDYSLSFGRIKDLIIVEDELTNFTPSQMNYLIKRSKSVEEPEPKAQKEPEPKPDHSYKAVKERNKFFR